MDRNALRVDWAPRLLSVLRILSALLFILHGSAKGFGLPAPAGELTPVVTVAALLEPVGAFLLLLGFFPRMMAVLLAGEMALAYVSAYSAGGLAPLIDGGEPLVLFCLNFLYVAAAGPGAWSLGASLRGKRTNKPL
jgi:putative oxidoreductase